MSSPPFLVINPAVADTGGPSDALWYVEPYMKDVYDALGKEARMLYKEEANRQEVWSSLVDVDTVIGSGHGNAYDYSGYKREIILWPRMVDSGFKREWIKDKSFLMLSCYTAKGLGPWMIQNGARNYVGWWNEFAFVVRRGKRHDPSLPDWLFYHPVAEAFIRIARGDAEEGVSWLKEEYARLIEDLSVPLRYKPFLVNNMVTVAYLDRGKVLPEGLAPPSGSQFLLLTPIAIMGTIIGLNELGVI